MFHTTNQTCEYLFNIVELEGKMMTSQNRSVDLPRKQITICGYWNMYGYVW